MNGKIEEVRLARDPNLVPAQLLFPLPWLKEGQEKRSGGGKVLEAVSGNGNEMKRDSEIKEIKEIMEG